MALKEKHKTKKGLKIIGWREWVSLPDFNISKIKVKVDTGARTSSLHAFDIEIYKRGKNYYATFLVRSEQRVVGKEKRCKAKILEFRKVKSSNGQSELRPVILTTINILDECYEIELTLTNRDEMGFRMLLGRESLRKRFLVDSGKSFYGRKKLKGIKP